MSVYIFWYTIIITERHLDQIREQPFDFYGGGGGQEDLSVPENFFCLVLEQENFFRRHFGPDYFF